MEIEFDHKTEKGKTPGTRMYSPKKRPDGRSAPAKGAKRGAAVQVDDTVIDEEGYRIHLAADKNNPAARIGVMLSAFLLAGMILFTLFGYEEISRAYADVNILKDEIELTKLRITALDVEIECAVTIQQAQEAAEAAHMQYPTQQQYVRIGDSIPFAGALPASNTPNTAGGQTGAGVPTPSDGAQPDGTYVPPLETG